MSQTIANLPIGAKVKLGKYSVNGESASPIIWLKIGSYPTLSDSVALLTEKIIDLRAYDAAESQSDMYNPRNYGNSDYGLSNIDQWLNKDNDSGEWFVKSHAYDESPTTTNTQFNTPYTNRPAFLNAFTEDEKNIILQTPIGVGNGTIYRKVFLLSPQDVLDPVPSIEYFYQADASRRQAYLTRQCLNNTTCQIKPTDITKSWAWLTRQTESTPSTIYIILESGADTTVTHPKTGQCGVRPALSVSSSTLVSDTTDSDGCYTIIYNQAPPTPTNLRTIPSTVLYAKKPVEIKWDAVVDADGDEVRYKLSRLVQNHFDEPAIEELIYEGTNTSFTDIAPSSPFDVSYVVRATDGVNESEQAIVTCTITNNSVPTISGSDTNLGVKTTGFTQTYVVDDVDEDNVTVTEYIDGRPIRSYNATLGATNTFDVTNEEWLKLSNGSHTLTITAQDETGDEATRNYTFIKNVTSFTIETNPIVATTNPTRIALTIGRNIPNGATFIVEVCNNAFDTNPSWEDCTSSVISNMVHTFENTTKTASQWAVAIRITVKRNGVSGSCYVDAIGGNFE